MHELMPDRAGQSGQFVFAMRILHAMAWLAIQGRASDIAHPVCGE